ncbi:MAG: pentapeptide repeat-containing protein [Pseudanabaena sp. M165S2SP1A06QC]|nr:pentapeptide repeat-containing protein [Pseudanabaena sp. M165S2SP1A06QC]
MSADLYIQNLRGQSFKGQNLSHKDFSGYDIRGTNFQDAILEKTNFQDTQSGLAPSRNIGLITGSLILVTIAGLVIGYSSAFPAFIANLLAEQNTVGKELLISVGLSILISFVFVIIRKGFGTSLGILAIITAIVTAIIAFTGAGDSSITAAAVLQAVIIAMIVAGILVESLALSIFLSITNTKALAFPIILALAIAILGAQEGVKGTPPATLSISLVLTGILATALTALSTYVSIKAMAGDKRYGLIRSISISLSTAFGTSFRGADLTDANFTQATLPHTDFRKANLKRTSWFQANKLELSRIEGTYLEDESLRQLVVTKDGHGDVYDYKNLQGLNLQAANLTDASFIGADLNEANLQATDFTRAKLVKTRLYGADLTHSCLSGACIQDWAISTDTQLEQVVCTHIYMRLQTKEDPDPWRKPDNRNETFKEGDFTDFIAPIIKTLDLYRQQNVDPRQIAYKFKSLDFYHYGGIDPAAAAVALKQLAEENPEAGLEVITLEGRGSEKIRLQAVVTGEANSSQLNAEYFEKYRQISSLPYSDIQSLLAGAAEKDERIRSLEKLLGDALQQPKFYVETYQNQGEFIMAQENKGNVNISGVQGNISGIAAAGENQTMTGVALGAISGNVTNTISQLPDTTDPNEPSLKELLTQLQALIESESELNEEDKVEALEQVKVLAESGQKPEDSTLQKLAKTAVKILKGTIASLPDVTKLVESGAKLLPYITKLLGLP